MSTKFTPGPWYAHCNDVVDNRPVGDSGVRFWDIGAAGPYRGGVAQCHAAEHIGGITLAERDANAHLIAAAPDLYEALVDLLENPAFHTAVGGNPIAVDHMLGRAQAALAKARGES